MGGRRGFVALGDLFHAGERADCWHIYERIAGDYLVYRLGIGQFTAIEVTPAEYVGVAAEAGFDRVSLLTISPNPQMSLPLITRDNVAGVKSALDSASVDVGNLECCMLTPHCDVEAFRPGILLGRELGATGVTAILFDGDELRTEKNLRQLCALARECGLRVSIEFMPMTPRWRTIGEAAALIRSLGEPNLGLCIDLLHLIRSGGTPAEVAATSGELIHYAQLCDGADTIVTADYGVEASSNRLAPGEGVFPIQDFLQALPAGTLLEIEVPQPAERPALDRVKLIIEAARRQLALAGLD